MDKDAAEENGGLALLQQHPEIDTTQTLMVNVNAFGASSLDFFIYCFTKTVNWQHFHVVKQDVLVKILAIVDKHGADVAYPTQVISLQQAESNVEIGRS